MVELDEYIKVLLASNGIDPKDVIIKTTKANASVDEISRMRSQESFHLMGVANGKTSETKAFVYVQEENPKEQVIYIIGPTINAQLTAHHNEIGNWITFQKSEGDLKVSAMYRLGLSGSGEDKFHVDITEKINDSMDKTHTSKDLYVEPRVGFFAFLHDISGKKLPDYLEEQQKLENNEEVAKKR